MKVLIVQPKLEKAIVQLERELQSNPHVDAVIFPEGYLNENVKEACTLAVKYGVVLIGGYRRLHEKPKDRVIMINRQGEIVIDRIKYSDTAFAVEDGLKIGHILCDELMVQGLKSQDLVGIDLIAHPIGVGMFSEEQFEEWISEARKVAAEYRTMIIGASHADGSFRNSDVSIPIAYCIGNDGEEIFVSKNNVQSVVLDTVSKSVVLAQSIC
ncbi:hypothetical protein FY534_01005 [Alicyclobacillus sp. TC]|uniref:Predicted amidohydrolase n=2 Tax=Alicyclobacillus tolerans TaxID=90970 RepID=A0A1M6R5F2_9BACL|nr:hypothetical protein FY534_01005 [Alicyclobacillus sp. TC]SHK27682.1 Predicted amidohydrolase [Alicyclobacillus montanus]